MYRTAHGKRKGSPVHVWSRALLRIHPTNLLTLTLTLTLLYKMLTLTFTRTFTLSLYVVHSVHCRARADEG